MYRTQLNTAKHTTSTDHCSTAVIQIEIHAHLCSAVSLQTIIRPRRSAEAASPITYVAMCYLSLS